MVTMTTYQNEIKYVTIVHFRRKRGTKVTSETQESEGHASRVFLNENQKLAIARWIFEKKEVLFGRLANNISSEDKNTAWEEIYRCCEAKGYPIPNAYHLRKVHF